MGGSLYGTKLTYLHQQDNTNKAPNIYPIYKL